MRIATPHVTRQIAQIIETPGLDYEALFEEIRDRYRGLTLQDLNIAYAISSLFRDETPPQGLEWGDLIENIAFTLPEYPHFLLNLVTLDNQSLTPEQIALLPELRELLQTITIPTQQIATVAFIYEQEDLIQRLCETQIDIKDFALAIIRNAKEVERYLRVIFAALSSSQRSGGTNPKEHPLADYIDESPILELAYFMALLNDGSLAGSFYNVVIGHYLMTYARNR